MKKIPKEWATYEYHDPSVVLQKLHKLRVQLSASNTPANIRNLRTNKLKPEREAWDAAVFCYLMSKATGRKIYFSRVEAADYDSVFMWEDEISPCFAPVQMKELVPEYTNPRATLEGIIKSLKKYVDSPDLVVGIKLNRRSSFDFSKIDVGNIPVGEVWCFGSITSDESKWGLFGDLLTKYQRHEYALPNALRNRD